MQIAPMSFVICSNTSAMLEQRQLHRTSASMNHSPLQINAVWDAMAAVWVVTSDDIPGLITESPSLNSLQAKLRVMIPELLRLNHVIATDYRGAIAFELISHRQDVIEIAS
jgi:hypothetical protein